MLDGKNYFLHRLAWLYVYDVYPNFEIDHIDNNKLNNKIENLRLATPEQNSQNKKNANKNNISNFLGVTKRKNGKFLARITLNRKEIYIGVFNNAIDAHNAYLKAKKELHLFYKDKKNG